MKVILLQDVRSLGKKGDIVEVTQGYANNMLLKKKLGVEATQKAMNDLKLQEKHAEKVAEENLEHAKAFAVELEGKEVSLSLKTGEGGRTFGSISTKEISQAALDQCKLDIDKKKMVLNDPIKNLGVYEVQIKLHPQVTGTLKVKVTEE